MKYRTILNYTLPLIFISAVFYFASCDEKATIAPDPPPQLPNPYGDGNGKITFIRKQQIQGPVIIKIANRELNDTIVWQSTPGCDSSLAVSLILKAGSYTAKIEGSEFLCNYDITVEERICKIIEYTGCTGGYVGCPSDINGVWLRTADGPCPNCRGLKVEFRNGIGEVIYTPPGCRFPIGDLKWKEFNSGGCSMYDLARDDYGGNPEYQFASLTFYSRISFQINSESGVIPYTRIALANDKKISKNNKRNFYRIAPVESNRLRLGR